MSHHATARDSNPTGRTRRTVARLGAWWWPAMSRLGTSSTQRRRRVRGFGRCRRDRAPSWPGTPRGGTRRAPSVWAVRGVIARASRRDAGLGVAWHVGPARDDPDQVGTGQRAERLGAEHELARWSDHGRRGSGEDPILPPVRVHTVRVDGLAGLVVRGSPGLLRGETSCRRAATLPLRAKSLRSSPASRQGFPAGP